MMSLLHPLFSILYYTFTNHSADMCLFYCQPWPFDYISTDVRLFTLVPLMQEGRKLLIHFCCAFDVGTKLIRCGGGVISGGF